MADVYSANFISFGIVGFAVEGTPSESERTDEEVVESGNVCGEHDYGTDYP